MSIVSPELILLPDPGIRRPNRILSFATEGTRRENRIGPQIATRTH